MLILSRKVGEEIVIANHVRVRIASLNGAKVRLGITAPASVAVHRAEIQQRREFQGVDKIAESTRRRA